MPELIDKWISCSLANKDEKLNKLAKEVNTDKHTKSCQKGNDPCRFSFPRLPSDRTLISNPLSKEDLCKEIYQKKLDESNKVLSEMEKNELKKSSLELGKDLYRVRRMSWYGGCSC